MKRVIKIGWSGGDMKTLKILYDVVFSSNLYESMENSHVGRHLLAIQTIVLLMMTRTYRARQTYFRFLQLWLRTYMWRREKYLIKIGSMLNTDNSRLIMECAIVQWQGRQNKSFLPGVGLGVSIDNRYVKFFWISAVQ